MTYSGTKRANTNPINIRRYGRLLSESRKNEMAHRYLRRCSGDLCRLSAQEKTDTGIIFQIITARTKSVTKRVGEAQE